MANTPGIQRDKKGIAGSQLTGCQYTFSGMNNVIDPTNLDVTTGRVVDGINVDFNDTNSVSIRKGYVKQYSGAFHSGWSTEDESTAYMVSNGWIYEFDGQGAPYAILQLSSNSRCEFCQVNDVVAYSNGIDFGVIGGSFNQQRLYSPDFKSATLGGKCLEFYNGRLYFARGNSLYCTDTFDIEHVDVRFTHVATFQHTITMCKCVKDGLWIGTEKYVYFLSGDDIRTTGFNQVIVAKAGVVYGTACKTNAEYVPEAQNTDSVIVFLTTNGICSGGNGGKYKNHSFNEVSFDVGASGTATIHTSMGISQYIVIVDMNDGYNYSPYTIDIDIPINTLNTQYIFSNTQLPKITTTFVVV